MKKLYSFLAAAGMALAATAATPSFEYSGVSLNSTEIAETPVMNAEKSIFRKSGHNAWKVAPARVPAAESLIDIADTTYTYVCNYDLFNGQEDYLQCNSSKIRPVKGKENTYTFDFFQIFSDLTLKAPEGVLDPETGIITFDSNQVLASAEDKNGVMRDYYLKPAFIQGDTVYAISKDNMKFMLAESSIICEPMIAICSGNRATGVISMMGIIFDGEIGWFNTLASDKYGIPYMDQYGQPKIQYIDRIYGLFAVPNGGRKVDFLNAFGMGSWNYMIEGDYNAAKGYIQFDDAVLYEAYDGGADVDVPVVLCDGNDAPSVQLEYSDVVELGGGAFPGFELIGYELSAIANEIYIQKTFQDVRIVPLINLFGIMADAAEIEADNTNAPVEYFNLQGVRVNNPENGVYIRRQGSDVQKVLVK